MAVKTDTLPILAEIQVLLDTLPRVKGALALTFLNGTDEQVSEVRNALREVAQEFSGKDSDTTNGNIPHLFDMLLGMAKSGGFGADRNLSEVPNLITRRTWKKKGTAETPEEDSEEDSE